jgi:hypothetical protein
MYDVYRHDREGNGAPQLTGISPIVITWSIEVPGMSEWTGFTLYKGTWCYRARQPSSLTAIACIANLQKVSIGLMPVNPDGRGSLRR